MFLWSAPGCFQRPVRSSHSRTNIFHSLRNIIIFTFALLALWEADRTQWGLNSPLEGWRVFEFICCWARSFLCSAASILSLIYYHGSETLGNAVLGLKDVIFYTFGSGLNVAPLYWGLLLHPLRPDINIPNLLSCHGCWHDVGEEPLYFTEAPEELTLESSLLPHGH